MPKFKELQPEEYLYLENLFNNSNLFKEDVARIRKNYQIDKIEGQKIEEYMYSDRMNTLRVNKDYANKFYKGKDKKLYENFIHDIEKIAKKYYIEKYFKEFKKYILGRLFSPLSQKIIKMDEDGIHIELTYNITKEEFLKIWKDIEISKQFGERFLISQVSYRKRKKAELDFDVKLLLYKEKYEGYIFSKDEARRIGTKDNSQKNRYIREMKEYIESIDL